MSDRQEMPVSQSVLAVRTADPQIAHAELQKLFVEHELQVSRDGRLDFTLDVVPSESFVFGRMGFGVEICFEAPPMESAYQINIPLRGTCVLDQHGRKCTAEAGRQGVVMDPVAPVSYRWDEVSRQFATKLPRQRFEAHAARLVGASRAETIEFEPCFDLTSEAGQSVMATMDFVFAELSRPGGLAAIPSARSELESLLMTQLLAVVPNQYTPMLNQPGGSGADRAVRDLVDRIERDPAAVRDTADLVAMSGLAPRALQLAFREHVGTGPMAFVRGVRLDRVRHDLLNGRGSVTEVAATWGFHHPGHFARHYRERFGVSPSETLRSP
ncbi:AraC family transcriptional regulator [Amycolatopsis sp. Poz14]|uniref:AraC family transcriptional regulator n=1 Tax=Amycolatopsis sp. Poz14 TaxID=1447705 RepID=UPI001EE89B3B|nr:AraC family transcriptional regulator [Amycolatopsis sp. Poz14]MCG3754025.1 AraC family transcriptional regulator [Amycolatopsis sp. Poz14]